MTKMKGTSGDAKIRLFPLISHDNNLAGFGRVHSMKVLDAAFGQVNDEEVRSLIESLCVQTFRDGGFSIIPIKRVWGAGVRETFCLKTWERRIVATGDHSFLCEDGSFRFLSELKVGMKLVISGTDMLPAIDMIKGIEPAGEQEVFCLEAADSAHNFIANGFVVRN